MPSDSEAKPGFNAFYERYAPGCRELRVAPLYPEVLLVLFEESRAWIEVLSANQKALATAK